MHPFNGINFALEESDLAVERVDGELQAVAATRVRGGRRRLGPGRRHCHHRDRRRTDIGALQLQYGVGGARKSWELVQEGHGWTERASLLAI